MKLVKSRLLWLRWHFYLHYDIIASFYFECSSFNKLIWAISFITNKITKNFFFFGKRLKQVWMSKAISFSKDAGSSYFICYAVAPWWTSQLLAACRRIAVGQDTFCRAQLTFSHMPKLICVIHLSVRQSCLYTVRFWWLNIKTDGM